MFFRNTNWKYVMEDIVDFFRRLAIRRWINTNPRPVIFITNISVIVFVLVLLHTLNSGNSARNWEPRKDWFYDLNTGALFAADRKLVPPIPAPSGPLPNGGLAGVRAYVFSYAAEPNESQRFIGFLETTDLNYSTHSSSLDSSSKWGQGRLIRRPQDKQWFRADSQEGREILKQALVPNRNGENPFYCYPK